MLFVVSFLYAWFIRWITEIAVTDRRVIYKRGFITRHTEEMNMDKVESVDVDQSILGRLLDYGTVHVIGTGGHEHQPPIADAVRHANAMHREVAPRHRCIAAKLRSGDHRVHDDSNVGWSGLTPGAPEMTCGSEADQRALVLRDARARPRDDAVDALARPCRSSPSAGLRAPGRAAA